MPEHVKRLRAVRRKLERLEAAREERVDAIREATEAGMSLRAIADELGVHFTRVRQLLGE